MQQQKSILLGDVFPNFSAETTIGPINFHDFVGDSWACLCSHPADFTPVCTTELSLLADLVPEYEKRNVKLCALSCNDVASHKEWIKDLQHYRGADVGSPLPFPIIADPERKLAHELGMIDPDETSAGLPMTCRAVFIVGPDKKLKLSILYPASCGRNMDELLRVIDSLQLTANNKVATPVNWKKGCNCMVLPNISAEEAKALFPKGVETKEMPSKKEYMRNTADPSS